MHILNHYISSIYYHYSDTILSGIKTVTCIMKDPYLVFHASRQRHGIIIRISKKLSILLRIKANFISRKNNYIHSYVFSTVYRNFPSLM